MPAAKTGYEVVSDDLSVASSPVTLTAPTGTAIAHFFAVRNDKLASLNSDYQAAPSFDGSGNVVSVVFTRIDSATMPVHIVCVGL